MKSFVFGVLFLVSISALAVEAVGASETTGAPQTADIPETVKKFRFKAPSFFQGWKTASRESAKVAPLPSDYRPAVVQIYRAPLWGLRGWFADHMWISTKKEGASSYTVYEVIGWRKYQGHDSFLRVETDIPDRVWFGKQPKLLSDLRGREAKALIDKIHHSALQYPYRTYYAMLGPNSNTFIAWVLCQVPELNVHLSRRAIGKNYLKDCRREESIRQAEPSLYSKTHA